MPFQIHTPETAPEAARETLHAIEQRYGFLPNLAGVFAASPGAFNGLLSALKSNDDELLTLSPKERQVVQIAVSVENRCDYCTAAHSMLISSLGMPRDQIDRLHSQERLDDSRLDALRSFATEIVRKRGVVDDEMLEAFLAAGFGEDQVLEVLLAVSLKTLTNYANHIARPAVNPQFSEFLPDWASAA